MSFQGLSITSSGLFAAQRALEVTSHNLANVGTPGYSRQVTSQAAIDRVQTGSVLGPGASGNGVMITGVDRVTDALVDASLRSSLGTAGFQSSRASYLERAEQVLGPLDDGLLQDLTAFWNAWEDLSLRPDGAAERLIVLERADQLAQSINRAGHGLEDLARQAALESGEVLGQINSIAATVAELNQKILASPPNTPNGLLDERDRQLDALAELSGAKARPREDGQVDVLLGGQLLVSGNRASPLEITGVPSVVQFTSGLAATPGGSLAGLLSIETSALAGFTAELDAVAQELVSVVNSVHATGTDLNGLAGQDFFVGTSATSFALRAGIGRDDIAASLSGAAADGDVALAIAAIRDTAVVGASTVDDLARGVLGQLGSSARSARSRATVDSDTAQALRAERASASGVDMDEELSALLRYQRAYEASARALTVMDEALDRLINGTGRVGR